MTGRILGRRTVTKVRYYLLWDCNSCNTRGINANTCKQCPNCGNPKESDEGEYRSSTPVDDTYKHTGADGYCEHCSSDNKKRFSCRNCGAALKPEFEKQVERFTHRDGTAWRQAKVQVDSQGYLPTATNTPWNDGSSEPVVLQEPVEEAVMKTAPPPPPQRPRRPRETASVDEPVIQERTNNPLLLIIGGIVLVLALVGYFIYQRLHDFTVTTATATEASWTYSLPREDYAARSHSHETESYFWRPPSDAFGVSSYPTITRYETIYESVYVDRTCTRSEDNSYNDTDGTWVYQIDQVDYDCSGYEERAVGQEPVYGTRWTWQQMEWQSTTPLTASGRSHTVSFPVFTPTTTLRQSGDPVTTFIITYVYHDEDGEVETASRQYPRSVWEDIAVDRDYRAIIDGFDRLRAVESIDPSFPELLERAQ